MLRVDELEMNPELKPISYDMREEGESQGDETVFSLAIEHLIYPHMGLDYHIHDNMP